MIRMASRKELTPATQFDVFKSTVSLKKLIQLFYKNIFIKIPKYCKFNLSFNILKSLFEIKVLEQYVNLKKDKIFDHVDP